ncbi:MAG: hypothetical protein A3D74_00970 [Candidatus Levybacteria bacterium RIFCSPHIGHO2_02_FULL_37_13]|nr:MAG: hypothetical protein A3D74_00970 [Candidatus Levybacteria bacterium RIFCSPHIGHO2_02_FULL_37_13]OGH29361.1 MAG: hypothetical protein A3E40_00750 [Candidatus Levybacteria bacterium RIFCSPHIGHO2_12_FULL_37_9]OGH39362.1 MAG: hypothetical protein A3B41_03090 [Candidatus Levybacteria bacterium RIFCSPLOWO2_01_FULL_37_26]
MGVVRPPWISKSWFEKCPFNYCDHFGNQEVLATICKVCKEDVERNRFYKKAGKNPNDWKYVFQEMVENFAKVHKMIEKDAKRLGIDLTNIPDEKDSAPEPETYPIFLLMQGYGDHAEKIIKNLSAVPIDSNMELVTRAVDGLAHSRGYVIAKTARAINSRYEEKGDENMQELADSKTSALFVYMAIERNSRALLALAKHKPLRDWRENHVKFASVSLDLLDMLREEFFPEDILDYEEFGSEEYDRCFKEA